MPWMPWKPGSPPGSTGDAAGSTAAIQTPWRSAAQHLADAGDGAAGADARDEGVDAGELRQDLRTGRATMRLGVGRVAELLRHVPVGMLGQQLLGAADGAMHALRVGGELESVAP